MKRFEVDLEVCNTKLRWEAMEEDMEPREEKIKKWRMRELLS